MTITSSMFLFFLATRQLTTSPLFPYTTLFRSHDTVAHYPFVHGAHRHLAQRVFLGGFAIEDREQPCGARSEEHTSELQSRPHLVCRLLLEKKKRSTKPVCAPANAPEQKPFKVA